MLNAAKDNNAKPLENFSEATKKATIEKALTTIKAKAVEEVVSLTIDKKQQGE